MTEKTDAYLDNLQVGVELWDKQLMLGEEVDRWAGAKLALFAEGHPFHSEQQVLSMKVRLRPLSFLQEELETCLRGSAL